MGPNDAACANFGTVRAGGVWQRSFKCPIGNCLGLDRETNCESDACEKYCPIHNTILVVSDYNCNLFRISILQQELPNNQCQCNTFFIFFSVFCDLAPFPCQTKVRQAWNGQFLAADSGFSSSTPVNSPPKPGRAAGPPGYPAGRSLSGEGFVCGPALDLAMPGTVIHKGLFDLICHARLDRRLHRVNWRRFLAFWPGASVPSIPFVSRPVV